MMPNGADLPTLNPGLNTQLAAFNFTCLSIPGAQTTQYFAGTPVKQQLTVPVLAGNLGYGVAVTTYAQQLTFNFVADPHLLPDLARMVDLCAEVMAELKETPAADVA